MSALVATRDAVLDSADGRLAWVTGDTGASWEYLGPADERTVYGRSRRTGVVVAVTRTGERVNNGQVRVRIDFPRDLGGVAGPLAFDAGHLGGGAPRALFA